jgi:hypothetical protein
MRRIQAAVAGTILVATTAVGAAAASAEPPGPPGAQFQVHVFATGTGQQFGPDDVVHLGPDVFVAWQNGVGSTGSPSSTGNDQSTLVEYQPNGSVVGQWKLTGKIDGLGADPAAERVIATVNEDGNSSLYTVTPGAAPAAQVQHYAYAPSGPLPHGGGTDSVTVVAGRIFIAASAPTNSTGPALYQATLTPGVATLQPVFFDDSSAIVANTNSPNHGQPVTLALTDPDSTTRVPAGSPRFGGDLLLDSQGDGEQIYVSDPGGPRPALSVLKLAQSVDDTVFPTDPKGTLYVTDGTDNEVFAVTGDFRPGTALTSVTPADANNPVNAPNYLGQLDLATGQITPLITTVQSKGLAFVPAGGSGPGDDGGS